MSLAHQDLAAPPRPELWVIQLGLINYDEALQLQQRVHDARAAGKIPDVLLLLEHPPIYTRGRRTGDSELPMGEDWYRSQGIEVRNVDRGGKLTYHGPGQLVGYPILHTDVVNRDIPLLVGKIEQAMIAALAGEGVEARADAAGRGVWAGKGPTEGKIGSIGLHVAENVTTHGFAVNVENDLQPFSWVRPCGLDDQATSIAKVTKRTGHLKCYSKRVAFELTLRLQLRQRLVSRARLEAALAVAADQVAADDLVLAP